MECYRLDDLEEITQERNRISFGKSAIANMLCWPRYHCCRTRSSHCPLWSEKAVI